MRLAARLGFLPARPPERSAVITFVIAGAFAVGLLALRAFASSARPACDDADHTAAAPAIA
jgi:hypothetical protein